MLACAIFRRNAALCKPAADFAGKALYKARTRPRPGFWRLEMRLEKPSSEGLDGRRRRLLFRAWHRGMREMDLVLGRFADSALAGLSDGELAEVERWLEIPDQQMFAYVLGTEPPPPEIDTLLFRRLCSFHGTAK